MQRPSGRDKFGRGTIQKGSCGYTVTGKEAGDGVEKETQLSSRGAWPATGVMYVSELANHCSVR